MSAQVQELPSYTFEEYLEFERTSPYRHEWVGGQVYLMPGGTERHDVLVQILNDLLYRPMIERGGFVFTHNRKLRTSGASYYPDLVIVCGKTDIQYENDARWVIEVTSPGTAANDRREKRAAYLQLPSLQGYLVLDPERPGIEMGRRLDSRWAWTSHGVGGRVEVDGVTLDVDTIYDDLATLART